MPDSLSDQNIGLRTEVLSLKAEVAELKANLKYLERQLLESKAIPVEVFNAYTLLRQQVEKGLDVRIEKLEEAQTWAFRLLIGTFIGLITEGAIIALKISGHG